MDELNLATAARGVAPYLNWASSTDGNGQLGTGLPFMAATVGTTLGPASVCITSVAGRWVCEVTLRTGSVLDGEEKTILLQTTGAPTARAAWESMRGLSGAAGSFCQGLDEAQEAWAQSDEGRLNAIGLSGVELKVGP